MEPTIRPVGITLLLSVLVVIEAGKVPDLPSGRRTQYYIQTNNGGYKYGYDTGVGSYEKAFRNGENEVSGEYSYLSPEGPVSVQYSSGVEGFRPGRIITPGASLKSARAQYSHSNIDEANAGAQYSQSNVAGANTGAQYSQSNIAGANAGAQYSQSNIGANDKSYSFSYQAEDHSRHESSDAQGNVVGSFSYIPSDGVARKVDYEAGEEKGFIITGHSPQIPQSAQNNAVNSGYSLTKVTNKAATAPITHYHTLGYATIPMPVFHYKNQHQSVAHQAYGPRQQFISSTSTPWPDNENTDASYAFSYNTNDHSRKETSDSQGNIVGSYSYLSQDGDLKHVEYEAGAEKGFIAKGNHLPQINTQGYSFSYNAGDHSRHEAADVNGNVIGGYSFSTADGIKKIDYTAGTQGFIATGAHIPKIQENPQHSHTQSTSLFRQNPILSTGGFNYNVRTYLPPNNLYKTGYIYESQ